MSGFGNSADEIGGDGLRSAIKHSDYARSYDSVSINAPHHLWYYLAPCDTIQ